MFFITFYATVCILLQKYKHELSSHTLNKKNNIRNKPAKGNMYVPWNYELDLAADVEVV